MAVDLGVFEEIGAALRGLLGASQPAAKVRARPYGLKVWTSGGDEPGKVHYEAQLISGRHVAEAQRTAIEIGLHAEHSKVADNDAVVAALNAGEPRWRKVLGPEPVLGPFIGGRIDVWRRLSETWPDPDLDDGFLVLDVATRLVDYVTALEPVIGVAPPPGRRKPGATRVARST